MRTLKTLKFNNNALSLLPEGLGDDQILHTIDARNNKIENLSQPSDLRKLRLLEVLLLGGNQITVLPRSFESSLYSLRDIDLSNNQIVGFLMPKSLTSIILIIYRLSDFLHSSDFALALRIYRIKLLLDHSALYCYSRRYAPLSPLSHFTIIS